MTRTSWYIRDSTTDTLEEMLKRKYKEIDSNYKMLKKVSNIEDAKRLVEKIWQTKSFANAIEMELIRKEITQWHTEAVQVKATRNVLRRLQSE